MILIKAVLINLIIYLVFIIPSVVILLNSNFSNKKQSIFLLAMTIVFNSVLSICLYKFSYIIFSLFSKTQGVINLCIYISRIIFIDSSLYGIKIIIPRYIFSKNKKTAILILSKFAVNLILSIIGYILLQSAGLLYSFPICNFVFYIIYVFIFIKS